MRTLTQQERAALDQLRAAFADVGHDLWDGAQLNGAPTRLDELRELRIRGEENWSPEDIDWIFFKAATTIGTDQTVKFALVRLIDTLLHDANDGAVSAAIIPSKLEYAHFGDWLKVHRDAAMEALLVLAAHWEAEDGKRPEAQDLRAFAMRHRPQ